MDNRGCSRPFVTLGAIISFIASIIGIFVYLTGYETVKETGDAYSTASSSGRRKEKSPSEKRTPSMFLPFISIAPEPISTLPPVKPLEALETGSATFTIGQEYDHPRIGYNFKEGKLASESIPADITFENCYVDYYGPYCDLVGVSDIIEKGKIPLDDVFEFPKKTFLSSTDYCSNNCEIDTGYTYLLMTYDGHPAKFRTSNLQYIRDEYSIRGFTFTIQWVYQPNERMDFSGP